MDADGDSGAEETAGLFVDPPGFYAPTVPARTISYTRASGEVLTLQLPPQHSLLCLDGLSVAELGAGAGLPSLLAATTARAVVTTDYPDAPLLAALAANAAAVPTTAPITVVGLRWGDAPAAAALVDEHGPFDVVLMADLVSNHGAHAKLLSTLEVLVGGPTGGGVGVVAYGHHRVACVDADEAFFTTAADAGWHVGGGAVIRCAPMFADDPGFGGCGGGYSAVRAGR
ncbi:hypothetical protein MMPV_004935 [Pyropia vietnamensis]